MDDSCEYLVHYGVLGMKWGVRKDKKTSSKQKTEIRRASQIISESKQGQKTLGDLGKFVKKEVTSEIKNSRAKKARSAAVKNIVKTAISKNKQKKQQKENNKAAKKAEKEKKRKGVKGLSDEELAKRINRLEMEKKYNTLKKQNLSEGSKLAQDILKDSVKNIGTQAATYGIGKLVNHLAKSEIVNPKKGQKDK